MTVLDIVNTLQMKVFSGQEGLIRQVTGGYASDLLSDVMGNAREGEVWVTLQTHKNIMAVASLKDLAAIILVNGAKPDTDSLEESNRENLPVLGTELSSFEICGKLYNLIRTTS